MKANKSRIKALSITCFIALMSVLFLTFVAEGADIKVIPSATRVSPGENFYIDINVENIPSMGLGAVQFRLNIVAQGSSVTGLSDVSQVKAADVSVSAPLLIGPPAATRSGIGEFFWNATGPHGILVMDNEPLNNGSALYTFGHTNGSTPPGGGGSVARFHFAVGKDVVAERIVVTLSDVMLLDTGVMYPLDTNTGATIELRCITKVPNLLGLSRIDAQAALQGAGLLAGNIYEVDNQNKIHALNQVLIQSYAAGTSVLCETPVDLAINTAPFEVGNANAADKPNDESGGVILSWTPSISSDTAGYRVYLSTQLLAEVRNPSATGTEISGFPVGQVSQIKITSFDSFGNESSGVVVSATAADDIAPRITIEGVIEGAFYSSSVLPSISVIDSNLSTKEILLNGISYAMSAIGIEGNYTLRVTATDSAGNTATKEIHFVIDKTPPSISVSGVEKGRYYNTDIVPAIAVTEPNLQNAGSLLNGSPFISGNVISVEGAYELKVEATDKAGNRSTDTYLFYIDKTKPQSTLTMGGPKFTGNGSTYVSGVTMFTVSGEDMGIILSGIDRFEYRINNGLWSKYQSPFNLAGLNDGVTVIDYRAIDKAGNIEDNHTLTVNADNTPPLTDVTAGEPKFLSAGKLYVNGNAMFSMSATDALSGVSKTEYRIDGGQWLNYAAFTLPAEGTHVIGFRSTDNLGNTETEKTIEVMTDNTPPVSSANIGTPQYSSNGNTYIGGNTEISITASDAGSGAGRIEYSIDGNAFAVYAGAIKLSGYPEGSHVITYRSIDNLGNTEANKTLSVAVDNTPPSTAISVGEPKYIGSTSAYFITRDTVFTLSASDNLSGVSKTEYKIDAGEWTSYASFRVDSEGSHTISYRSIDNLGNIETEKTLSVVSDNTPPVTEITSGEPKFLALDGKFYITGSTNLSLGATDALSGVAKTEYRMDGGAWTLYASFAIPSEGTHVVEYRSTDNVGNIETVKTLTVIVDNTPPVTDITVGEPKFNSSDGKLYVTGAASFTLRSVDNLSGVLSTEYRIDSGLWQPYSPFAINAEGAHLIEYRSKDNVGNQESVKSISLIVDSTPPSTTITVGEPKYLTASGALYVTGDTVFTLGASDNLSGVSVTEYNIDSGEWTIYAPFKLSAEGTHVISYRSKDNVGNTETEKTLSAVIDGTPPLSELIVSSPKYVDQSGKTYATKDAVFTITAIDSASGVAKTEYRLDSGAWTEYAPFSIPSEGAHAIEYRSTDNVGNVETVKTLSVIIDNSAPLTEIITSEPKYTSADGKLYVAGNTTFTLTSSDNLSGVSKTEYRIDNSGWQVYSPFTITLEGAHTIGFRSMDNLGNTETEKTLTVSVDNTSPSTNISVGNPKHQAGENLYISGKTEITISAADTGSGIKKTEYSIDGNPFITYVSPLNLATYSEGSHTITYRSTDNLNNKEDAKTLIVTVDKTPPQTVISASDTLIEGVINIVSPKTRFTLNSTDNLSGLKAIKYRIDSGEWQPYIANFSLSGMEAGTHTITYKATDNVLNEEAEKTLTVRLISIEVSKSILTDPVVLAGAWWHHEYDHDDNGNGNGSKGDGSDNWHYDGDDGIKGTQNAINNLSNILASSGLAYYISGEDEDLKSAIRSGRFNTYVLVDFKNEDIGEEIREAVYYGAGLVFIKTKPFADPELDDVFGVKFTGMTTDSGLVVGLDESPICREGTFQSKGKSVVANITTGRAWTFGHESDRHEDHPAVIYTEYGRGKVILYNFNLLNTDEIGKAKELLINSINYVKPSETYLAALGSVPVTIKLSNSTEPVDVQLIETLPNGATVDNIYPSALQTNGTITWQKYLNMREKALFRYYLNMPDASGDFAVNTEVRYANNGEYRLYGNYSLTLNIQQNSIELQQDIITALRRLVPGSSKDSGEIRDAIASLNTINPYAATKRDAETNIKAITGAIDELMEVSVDISAIRLKLDEFLMVWQKKWYYTKH